MVGQALNIQIIANADLLKVEGYVGNFRVKTARTRYVMLNVALAVANAKTPAPSSTQTNGT